MFYVNQSCVNQPGADQTSVNQTNVDQTSAKPIFQSQPELALYSPEPDGRATGGFLYNAQLLRQLENLGWSTALVADAQTFHNAHLHLVDSLYAREYVQHHKDISNAVFLYHLPPYAGESVPDSWLDKERQLIENSQIIVSGTQALELLEARHRMTEQQIVSLVDVITPGIACNWERKTSFPSLPRKLIVVGSVIPEKGIAEIIAVLNELKTLDWQCHLYGERSQNEGFYLKMLSKVVNLGLSERIQFEGTVPAFQINKLMLDADLLLNFSRFETYSMVTAEAIATGLPVLTFPVGEIAEFQRAKNVQYVCSGSQNEQSAQLRRLLTDKAAFQALCTDHPQPVRTWRDVAQHWHDVLQARLSCGLPEVKKLQSGA